jgi:hypothetical protein
MPPKVPTNILRGRGRPKRSAAAEHAPVANAPTKSGRVASAAEVPKKRGRPARINVDESLAVTEAPKRGRRSLIATPAPIEEARMPRKRAGRPAKEKQEETEAPATLPKKRAGRPRKVEVAAEDALTTPKRRGRPARNPSTVDLSRVADAPHVTKNHPSATPKAAKAAAAPAPRMNPGVRSKLRTRLPPAQKTKEETAPSPTKRRGRPPKAATMQASPPQKATRRKTVNAAVAKPTSQRKKRGYTMLEIPDKFAPQLRQYLQELRAAESLPTAVEDGVGQVIVEGVEAEPGAEEDIDILVEEDIVVASATDAADEENVLALVELGGEENHVDSDAATDEGEDLDAREHDREHVIVQDAVDDLVRDSVSESASEVEIELNIPNIVQIEQGMDDADAFQQELDELIELDKVNGSYNDPATPLMHEESTGVYIQEARLTSSMGVTLG